MNLLDWCIIGVIAISTLAALGRGIVVELLSLLGLIGGIVLAGQFYGRVAAHLLGLLKVQALADMAGFLLIVVVVLLAATWIGHVIHNMAKYVGMGWLDSLLGAVFGLIRGGVAVTAAMMALAAFTPTTTWTAHSQLAPYFLTAAREVAVVTPTALRDKIDNGIWTVKQLSVVHMWK